MKKLFTERHGEAVPRVAETLDTNTRNALLTLVSARIEEEWFGLSFPQACSDGYNYAGTDFSKMQQTMSGYRLLWPQSVDRGHPPDDGRVFDILEFSYEFIAEPRHPRYHSSMSHTHYETTGRAAAKDSASM